MAHSHSYSPFIMQKIKEWKYSINQFAVECMHFQPSVQQAQAFHEFPKTHRLSIASGHGTGKDAAIGGVLVPWFMVTRAYPKVLCIAPTARQLADILWSEITKWLRQSLIADEFIIQKDKIFMKHDPYGGKEWWCRAVSPSAKASAEEQVESVAGFHGDHTLIVADEASGIIDPVYVALEGSMTQEDNNMILIGNMTKSKGYFYDSHYHAEIKKAWTKLHWDSRESTNVKPDYIEYMRNKYGEDSNVFRIRVMGLPPLEDFSTFIPLEWAQACIGNEITIPEDSPLYLGVDVARYGEDSSIILPRIGNKIDIWTEFRSLNTISLAGHVQTQYVEMGAEGVALDEIGVGAGVVDWLTKKNLPGLFGVNVASASSDNTKYGILRDELWAMMREKCMRRQYSFPDVKLPGDTESLGQKLANELSSPKYDYNVHGGFVIESKKRMKARGIASPNIADALALTEYFYNISTQVFGTKQSKMRRKLNLNDRSRMNRWDSSSTRSWQVS